jgi:type I restriction enzyme M protein
MLTGELRNKVDRLWDTFWSGGISNPLEVIEQITYLLFLRRLDDLHTLEESKAAVTKKPMTRRIFPEGKFKPEGSSRAGIPYDDMRWSRLKNREAGEAWKTLDEYVFPWLRQLGGEGSSIAKHMQGARFTIPTPALLGRVVDMIEAIPMEDRDTKGDLYEYLLSKIATAGQNGQFRTPRHIIQLMVELTKPKATDIICDPASGTCGFLVAAGEYLRKRDRALFTDPKKREHFHNTLFHGFDFDATMMRVGAMNMLLHGVDSPVLERRDSLSSENADVKDAFTLILANPPFAGSLDSDGAAKDLLTATSGTRKTELLFLAAFLRMLKPGGRAAVIVPDGVLFGSSKAHKELRRTLVEEHKLDAVIKLPSGVFRPYAGVSTAILMFTKTNSGGTDDVWFYDVQADGWSLDDKRNPLLPEDKLGPTPVDVLADEDYARNNLPDVLARWEARHVERDRPRTEQSFLVPKAEIAAQGYDLSLNRYKEVVHKEAEHRPPREIIDELKALEAEIAKGLDELAEMVG